MNKILISINLHGLKIHINVNGWHLSVSLEYPQFFIQTSPMQRTDLKYTLLRNFSIRKCPEKLKIETNYKHGSAIY